MIVVSESHYSSTIETLLESEREIPIEPASVRNHVLGRARVAAHSLLFAERTKRGWSTGGVAVILAIPWLLCGAAFYAGHRMRSRTPAVPVPAQPLKLTEVRDAVTGP